MLVCRIKGDKSPYAATEKAYSDFRLHFRGPKYGEEGADLFLASLIVRKERGGDVSEEERYDARQKEAIAAAMKLDWECYFE